MIAKSHRWQKTASALAAAALLGLWGTNAAALSLGRITVQSALGEPLRAEIDVPDINAEESNTLNARIASPDAFQAAGLEYNAVMPGVQVSLQRRPDGRAFFRLASTQAVNDPFVDLILEANWSSGRIVRDYTLLFDPPNLKSAAPATTAAQLPAQTSGNKANSSSATVAATPAVRPAAPAKAVAAKPVASASPTKPEEKTETQVTVKTGDTAGRIASNAKPSNVSLDQMLVALLRANPEAFVGGNINRIRAGSVLELPSAEKAQATPAAEATQIIVAQSKDFNDFRRKLAGSAPSTQVAEADKKASGSVQTKVEEKKPVATTPDKLTLSKGSVQGKPAADKLAKEGNAKEAAGRTAEIAKNISDLNKLSAASSTATAGAVPASKAPSAPVTTVAVPVAAPVSPVTVASAPIAPVSAPALAASKPAEAAVVASAPKPTVAASAKKPVPAPEPQPEAGLLDGLLNDPLVPMGAGGLLALLAGWGLYRFKQKKDADKAEKDAMDSRLQPESFFGTSGGQSVDTNDRGGSSSSMAYSPSQLDAVDDVDPVAEADVYLAYGRDLQAEEILKEALRTNPTRVAIHQKLCEIFAKRNDTKSYEDIASQAFKLTNGTGPDWQRICEGGLNIDPGNVLYQPGGQPEKLGDSSPLPLAGDDTQKLVADPDATLVTPAVPSKVDANGVDLDLDLDFSIDDESAISEALPSHELSTVIEPRKSAANMHDLDFGMSTVTMEPFATPQSATAALDAHAPDATLPLITPAHPSDSFRAQAATSFGTTEPAPLSMTMDDRPLEKDQPTTESGMLEFDLGGLSLDLGGTSPAPLENPVAEPPEDPLGTKLALAEEFRAIGDDDGARALIEEVIMEATGDMKIKAQRALNNL